MAAPLLTVMGRCQQVIDHLLPRVRRLVFDEGTHFGGSGREPDQVEVGATNQAWPGRLRLHLPTPLFELGQDEGVNRRAHLVLVCDGWRRRLHGLAERPPVTILRSDLSSLSGADGSLGLRRRLWEPSVLDVGLDQLFFGDGQLASLRHLVVFDQLPHEAALRLAGRNDWPGGTAFHHPGKGTQVKLGHFALWAVALNTTLFQDRQNLRFEEWVSLRRCRGGKC